MLRGGPLREVVQYLWMPNEWLLHDGTTLSFTVPTTLQALSYWDGSLKIEGKQRFIIVDPGFELWPEPDIEVLACGHQQPVRTSGKRRPKKFYNRRRRCIACALEVA